jgi:hypothetical protein
MLPSTYGSSYEQLLAQMRKNLRDLKVSEEMYLLLQSASGNAFAVQDVVLSTKEKERLFRTVQKEVLTELLEQLDKS